MAERGNPKSQPGKGQPSPQRRGQVAVPTRDPGAGHRPPPPAPAAPSASSSQSRGHRLCVPNAQDTRGEPGASTAVRGWAGGPGDSPEPSRRRVRLARLTEARLSQLGRISRYQRVLEWLEGTFPTRAEAVVELPEELDGHEEFQEHGNA